MKPCKDLFNMKESLGNGHNTKNLKLIQTVYLVLLNTI